MIRSLRGKIGKREAPFMTIDVSGVGYEVQCTDNLFELAIEGEELVIEIYTLVREDRLDLFGFKNNLERKLFVNFLSIPGVGPRTALQLCSVPVNVLYHAVEHQDARSLSSIKGVGKKMSEKLLVELSSLAEKGILAESSSDPKIGLVDEDALEALANLGYDKKTIIKRLQEVGDVDTTEERVKKVLQSL